MKKMFVLLLLAVLMVGCAGSGRQVTRMEPNTQTDLSGSWNDTDSRLVAEEMINDCLRRPWLTDFVASAGKKPVVTVGTIRNMTSEHINTETFTSDFERELTNSGQVRFVARRDQRAELRSERTDQQEWASAATMKQLKAETGADFALLGAIKTIVDQEGGKKVVFYQTDLELINIESMEKVWIGTKKIKKGISQGKWKP